MIRLNNKQLQHTLENPKVKNYLNITLTFFVVAIFLAFAIRPSLKTAINLRKDIKTYQAIDDQLSEKIVNISKARKLQSTIKDILPLLDKSIPPQSYESNILKNLNYIAIKHNIEMEDISYKYKVSPIKNVVEMEINIVSNYTNILNYLNDVNNLLRIINIKSVSVESVEKYEHKLLETTIEAEALYDENNPMVSDPNINIDNSNNSIINN